ncbi:MAG: DedA family protein [Minisyncoccota bacterium]
MDLFNIPHLLTTYGYIGVFVIVFLESGVIFALPGDSLLFTAGLLASGIGFDLYILIPIIFIATFLGGICGYFIGVYLERLNKFKLFRKIIRRDHLDTAHKFFEKHGLSAILISRFVPIVRTFLPIVAGIARMNFGKFVRYSLVSSFIWSTSITLLGYYLGIYFPWIQDYIKYIIVLVILVSVIPIIFEWRREKQNQAT